MAVVLFVGTEVAGADTSSEERRALGISSSPVALAEGAGNSYRAIANADSGAGEQVWREISLSGTKLELTDVDDGFVDVPLSFPFPFFGRTFDRVYVASNGVVSFDAGCELAVPFRFPCPDAPVYLVAAFWFDLFPGSGADGGDYGGGAVEPSAVYFKSEADLAVIQFSADAQFYGAAPAPETGTGRGVSTYYQEGFYTFQIVLHRSGTIDLAFRRMEGATDTAVVGLQGPDGAVLRIENADLFAAPGRRVSLRFERVVPTPQK